MLTNSSLSTRRRQLDLRTLLLILGAALLGAAWAVYNLQQVGDRRAPDVLRPLVWVVFAIPCCGFLGWLAARRAEGWRALLSCLATYFFSLFIAARSEQLLLGREQADLTGHALYFKLAIGIQLLTMLALALQRAWSPALGQQPR